MAITSVGYGGTIDETAWTGLAPYLGREYSVSDAGDFKPSTVSAAVRTVKVTAGTAVGYGVADTSDGDVQKVFDESTSGSRYDLVVLRRNWDGAGGLTTVEVVKGTASRNAVFALRNTTPGDLDDQPLALVKITAGQSLPTEVSDVRLWSTGGGSYANSTDVLQYATAPGTTIRIGSSVYVRSVSATSGAAAWTQYPAGAYAEAVGQATITVAAGAGTGTVTLPVGRFSVAPIITLQTATTAGFASTLIARVSSNVPPTSAAFTISVNSTSGASVAGTLVVNWRAVQMTSSAAAG